jgi:hypothetical protein
MNKIGIIVLIITLPLIILFINCTNDKIENEICECKTVELNLNISECLSEDILDSCFFYPCFESDGMHIATIDPCSESCFSVDCNTIQCDEIIFNITDIIDSVDIEVSIEQNGMLLGTAECQATQS